MLEVSLGELFFEGSLHMYSPHAFYKSSFSFIYTDTLLILQEQYAVLLHNLNDDDRNPNPLLIPLI